VKVLMADREMATTDRGHVKDATYTSRVCWKHAI